MPDISTEKAGFIVAKASTFEVEEGGVEAGEASNRAAADFRDVLGASTGDPVVEEMTAVIDALPRFRRRTGEVPDPRAARRRSSPCRRRSARR